MENVENLLITRGRELKMFLSIYFESPSAGMPRARPAPGLVEKGREGMGFPRVDTSASFPV